MAKGAASSADALILDLEDSVAAPNRPTARGLVREVLQGPRDERQQLWVRINPLDTEDALTDLASVVPGRPDGIVVPKIDGPADLVKLSHYLDALERAHGLAAGRIRILPVATETAASVFALGSYKNASARLLALTWGAEDLAAALGASANRDADARLLPTFQLARTLCLVGAQAAGVLAIETVFPDFRNLKALEVYATEGRRDGFRGMMAIHPDQVDIINRAFTPSESEIAWARRVVEAFGQAGTGVVGLDGQMLDMPHLKQAQKILAQISS
jgi:citrate lyase subunit beta/citryl-CoA lyase